jgi:HD superfamily phosphohydrolase
MEKKTLCWKMSEVHSIASMFTRRNDMFMRVYFHKVVQALNLMLCDMFAKVAECREYDLPGRLDDVERFVEIDERILYRVERGEFGNEARAVAVALSQRKIYKFVGETFVRPEDKAGQSYSQSERGVIAKDIVRAGKATGTGFDKFLRPVTIDYQYGTKEKTNPLLDVPFWKKDSNGVVTLDQNDLSLMLPKYFTEKLMRLYVTSPERLSEAKVLFEQWKQEKARNGYEPYIEED